MAAPLDPTRVFRAVASFDPASAGIGALERMVLAQVDGRASLQDLSGSSGLEEEDLARIVSRLLELGAIAELQATLKDAPVLTPAAPVVAVVAAEDGIELDPEIRATVVAMFASLEEYDHYQLLGVARDADRKAIKSAYYALAAKLHTDRYFGKKLGHYKAKMEAVFGRITIAHDTLAAKARRAEYDTYLKDRDRTRAYEQLLNWATVDAPPTAPARPPPPPSRAGVLDAQRLQATQVEPSTPPPVRAAPPSPPVATPTPAPVAVTPAPIRVSVPLSPEQERARRLAAAQRLTGARGSAPRMPPVGAVKQAPVAPMPAPPPAPSPEAARAATESLKARYLDSVEAAKRASAKRQSDAGDEAAQREDFVTAANHYRLALGHSDDPVLKQKFETANARARQVMADTYAKQAAYEESQGKWREASLSYAKATDARPDDAALAEKAANAFRREGKDLHRAARFAELAVQKNPASAEFRVTLGLVYLDAGLLLRAKSELEHAVRLAPDDAKAKELLDRLRKQMA